MQQAYERQIALLQNQVGIFWKLAENRKQQLEGLKKKEENDASDAETRLREGVKEYKKQHGTKGVVSAVARILVEDGEGWGQVSADFKAVGMGVAGRRNSASQIKRFADGLAEASVGEGHDVEQVFYKPSWRPILDHWGTIDELKTWLNPLGLRLWPEKIVRNMLHDTRLLTKNHAFSQPSHIVAPLAVYTFQLYQPTIFVVWTGTVWELLPETPFRPTSASLYLKASVAGLISENPDTLLHTVFRPEVSHFGLTLYTSPESPDTCLLEYTNTATSSVVSPFRDTVLWMPPYEVIREDGFQWVPSGVIEYIFSRDYRETLRSVDLGGSDIWEARPFEDDMIAELIEEVEGANNMLVVNQKIEEHIKVVMETGHPAVAEILKVRLRDVGDVTPQLVLNVLNMQQITYDGRLYIASLTACGKSPRVLCTPTGSSCICYQRLAASCNEQIFRLINHTMRAIQCNETSPVLTIDGLGELSGDYVDGGAVAPFTLRSNVIDAKAQWSKGVFLVSAGGKPALTVTDNWTLKANGSMIRQVQCLIYFIDSALAYIPTTSTVKCYRGLANASVPQYKNGAVLLWAAFSSTSLDASAACSFGQGTVFSVRAGGAKSIAKWSRFSRERELLFKANTWLQVSNALTSELAELAGVNAKSQLFELDVVTQTAVHCARLRTLFSRVRSASCASILFQLEEALCTGDCIADLSLPSPSVGEAAPTWQVFVTPENGNCPCFAPSQWTPVPAEMVHHITKLLDIRTTIPVQGCAHREKTYSNRQHTPPELEISSLSTSVRGPVGCAALKAAMCLLNIENGKMTDVTIPTAEPEQKVSDTHLSITVSGRDTTDGVPTSWRAAVKFRKTGGRRSLAAGMEGACLVAAALELRVPLREINLRNHRIPSRGVSVLLEALRKSNTVVELELGNSLPLPRKPYRTQFVGKGWMVLRKYMHLVLPWYDVHVESALRLRCMVHRHNTLNIKQLKLFANWEEVVVRALWDMPDVMDVLPVQQLMGTKELEVLLLNVGRAWKLRMGTNPSHLLIGAVKAGHAALVDKLLDIFPFELDTVCDTENHTPLFYASRHQAFNSKVGVRSLKRLFTERALKQQSRYNGWTPLHVAVNGYNSCTVVALLEMNADANVHDYEGRTPMGLAASLGFQSLVDTLREYTDTPSGLQRATRLSKREKSYKNLKAFLHKEPAAPVADIIIEDRSAKRLQLQWRAYKGRQAAEELSKKGTLTAEDQHKISVFHKTSEAANIVSTVWTGTHRSRGL
eukprot:TRINITY_DN37674_c0_g1_i1.p1 TRINITY_DN37674_c0_g1~~TRINITY_DN37674_c0_g1_i1.p1  ORF type:complete len:1256 (+),score=260.25 TRINITY_DN37674_c0_g1_i1:40-3807(+)